ncbi:hypothetical protein Q5P01_000105 [Channa striata]|uniref:Ig-like domain-containing protein n=1 Tax=Channa striata TaxID=64152 RepID=A0AA88IQX8_CHASR|nr:hypothetical protein Q5P01_000105 [Channa striata]
MASSTSGTSVAVFTCLWIFVLTEDQQQITAKTGENVTLQCLDPRGGDIELLEWTRRDLNVFVWRRGKMSEDDQHESFKNRVELRDPQMKNGNVSITAKTGENVTLQCLDPRGGDIELLEWMRRDLNVFVWKHGKLSKDDQHESFKNRVELKDPQMKNGNFSVILKNVTINDTGTYECRVRNSNTQPPPQSICNITLTVIDSDQVWKWIHHLPDTSHLTSHSLITGGGAGRTDDGGDMDGRVGLIVGLSLCLVLLIIIVIYYLIYRKYNVPPEDAAD